MSGPLTRIRSGRGHDQQVADAALVLEVDHRRAADQTGWADTIAQYVWDAGCRDPDIAEAVATLRAASGTIAGIESIRDVFGATFLNV